MPMRRTTRNRSGAHHRSGFTIAELMVVIAIIAMASYVVGISFDALVPGERLNSSVRKLQSTLQSTRSEAISRNAEFWLEYDLEGERYRIISPYRLGGGMTVQEDEEFDERRKFAWTPLEEGIEIVRVSSAGEDYLDGTVMVRFDPLGAASDHYVILSQPRFESFFTVEVLALTGLIRLHDGIFEREEPDDGDFQ